MYQIDYVNKKCLWKYMLPKAFLLVQVMDKKKEKFGYNYHKKFIKKVFLF